MEAVHVKVNLYVSSCSCIEDEQDCWSKSLSYISQTEHLWCVSEEQYIIPKYRCLLAHWTTAFPPVLLKHVC